MLEICSTFLESGTFGSFINMNVVHLTKILAKNPPKGFSYLWFLKNGTIEGLGSRDCKLVVAFDTELT